MTLGPSAGPTGGPWDLVVIGTGFGGSMVALRAVEAGLRVLLVERGRWVERDESAWDPRAILIDRKYQSRSPYLVRGRLRSRLHYPDEAVGGKSVFYGAASFRLREDDFALGRRCGSDDGVSPFPEWPIGYRDLEPFYEEAERLLGVVGVAGLDPTEPSRRAAYPAAPPAYSAPARRVADAAAARGLRPFPIPLAINFAQGNGRAACVQCLTCDLFPCRITAKNDLAVTVLPQAQRRGAVVLHSTAALRLVVEHDRVTGVECASTATGERFTVPCRLCVVSAGAIGSAALLLQSGLGSARPHGRLIGRYLMRHCSGIVMGLFPFETNPERRFHKQLALTDFYFGQPNARRPGGPWGMIQGLQVPPPEFIAAEAPFPIGMLGSLTTRYHIYLMCIAQDMPSASNRVELDPAGRDPFGVPIPRLIHRYAPRDRAARRALYREAAALLRAAGAVVRVRKPINTFSHALGTCRFGTDPAQAVLDPWCRFFGMRNLFVVDSSFMPTSGGVNPSLTVAANALRVGAHVAERWGALVGRGPA